MPYIASLALVQYTQSYDVPYCVACEVANRIVCKRKNVLYFFVYIFVLWPKGSSEYFHFYFSKYLIIKYECKNICIEYFVNSGGIHSHIYVYKNKIGRVRLGCIVS